MFSLCPLLFLYSPLLSSSLLFPSLFFSSFLFPRCFYPHCFFPVSFIFPVAPLFPVAFFIVYSFDISIPIVATFAILFYFLPFFVTGVSLGCSCCIPFFVASYICLLRVTSFLPVFFCSFLFLPFALLSSFSFPSLLSLFSCSHNSSSLVFYFCSRLHFVFDFFSILFAPTFHRIS